MVKSSIKRHKTLFLFKCNISPTAQTLNLWSFLIVALTLQCFRQLLMCVIGLDCHYLVQKSFLLKIFHAKRHVHMTNIHFHKLPTISRSLLPTFPAIESSDQLVTCNHISIQFKVEHSVYTIQHNK